MDDPCQVSGANAHAPFTLKLHRGESMVLLAMNWREKPPPDDFVGFAIEYQEPEGDRYFALKNRLGFATAQGGAGTQSLSTRLAPIQMFRWVHFPRNAGRAGLFSYRVSPVFMNAQDELSYGEPQTAAITLGLETYANLLNVAFTRGFVSSQAFVDRYQSAGALSTLLPASADQGLVFVPGHPKTAEALAWMGFEARDAILALLDEAIADTDARVSVVAYDLNEPEVVQRLEQLKERLCIVIDDSDTHGKPQSAETQAAERLRASAGAGQVRRQHMHSLQHNKTIVVDGPRCQAVLCGSTNFSWRAFFVQSNNAVVLRGSGPVRCFSDAFATYWNHPATFESSGAAQWADLGLAPLKAKVAFSPHGADNALLDEIAQDLDTTQSSLFFSLAFLYQTEGPIKKAIGRLLNNDKVFVYGMSDREVGGLELTKPDGNVAPLFPAALTENVPAPFSEEPTGGRGIRMHHKFLVVDFDQPTCRVYLGSYNFSGPADTLNGENLLLIEDKKVVVAYVVEALRLFDHYRFRVAQLDARSAQQALVLKRPPQNAEQTPWWSPFYVDPHKIRDRELFA